MMPAVKHILKQSGTSRGLFVNDVGTKSITGYPPEININARVANLEPLCEVAPYYMVLNCHTIIGILP